MEAEARSPEVTSGEIVWGNREIVSGEVASVAKKPMRVEKSRRVWRSEVARVESPFYNLHGPWIRGGPDLNPGGQPINLKSKALFFKIHGGQLPP
jgi:hypothetical protein